MEEWANSEELMKSLDVMLKVPENANPKFGIWIEGAILSEYDGEPIEYYENTAEWELNTRDKVAYCRKLAKMITEKESEIIGWNPNSVEEESEDLSEWQRYFFEDTLIPVNDCSEYCDQIQDIQMFVSFCGAKLPVTSRKGEDL